jgi:hypothetical protein
MLRVSNHLIAFSDIGFDIFPASSPVAVMTVEFHAFGPDEDGQAGFALIATARRASRARGF